MLHHPPSKWPSRRSWRCSDGRVRGQCLAMGLAGGGVRLSTGQAGRCLPPGASSARGESTMERRFPQEGRHTTKRRNTATSAWGNEEGAAPRERTHRLEAVVRAQSGPTPAHPLPPLPLTPLPIHHGSSAADAARAVVGRGSPPTAPWLQPPAGGGSASPPAAAVGGAGGVGSPRAGMIPPWGGGTPPGPAAAGRLGRRTQCRRRRRRRCGRVAAVPVAAVRCPAPCHHQRLPFGLPYPVDVTPGRRAPGGGGGMGGPAPRRHGGSGDAPAAAVAAAVVAPPCGGQRRHAAAVAAAAHCLAALRPYGALLAVTEAAPVDPLVCARPCR